MMAMNREILRLAIPSILANITVPLVGIVDVAIAGHISDASAIGGIAIGSMLFDLLYWNFGFLRVGTGGLTAQAYGREDFATAMAVFLKSARIAIAASVAILALQCLFIDVAMTCIPCSAEVEAFARKYFCIRIWAAPATLSLMAFKGWFIGMQNTLFAMISDITVNIINMAASYFLAVHTPAGAIGVAYGTVIAQYMGLAVSVILMFIMLRRYPGLRRSSGAMHLSVFKLNATLFIRSLCMLFVYAGFTSLTSRYGDGELAAGSIIMKLFMIFSYFIDGFAYAGEALTGRFTGARDVSSLSRCIRATMAWATMLGIIFTAIYLFCGNGCIALITSDRNVMEESRQMLPWLVAMPLLGSYAFTWDGIYTGATAARHIMMSMVYSSLGFVLVYILSEGWLQVHAIYLAYITHLLVRTVYLTATKDYLKRF